MNYSIAFEQELQYIKDESIRKFAKAAIDALPEYFFYVAASSTGKYHPQYATGDGGLVRHTKAAVAFANELLSLEQYQNLFAPQSRDAIITALILHDGVKHGIPKGNFTSADHPLVVVEHLRNQQSLHNIIPQELEEEIYDNISSHMGQWNTDYKTKKEILPKPVTESQKFVHLCDYLASRKWLNVDFGENYFDPINLPSEPSELDRKIDEIISICKEKVSAGFDRESLYSIIKDTSGNRNPHAITDVSIADEILQKINSIEEV